MKTTHQQFTRSIAFCLGLFCFVIASTRGAFAAEVLTDQFDYQPGDMVYVLGSGFAPNETVIFQVTLADDTGLSGSYGEPWLAIADQNGNVITSWEVCPEECFEAFLHLIALGETSNEFAETFFTDAIVALRVFNVSSPSGSCARRQPIAERWMLEPGGTYTVEVLTVGTGSPICFSNDPPSIAVSLAANFGGITFILDRVPNTNQYRGTVTIPQSACGSTLLSVVCGNGVVRRLLGFTGGTNVSFVASSFPNGCASNVVTINCTPSGQPPTISCTSNIVTTTSGGLCGAQVFYPPPTATGNPAPGVTCTPASGSFFPVGVRIVTCRATNIVGTALCSFTVRVIDDDPPTIVCTDVCLATDPGTCSASGSRLPQPVASDNCGFSTNGTNRLTLVSDAPATLPLGTTIVTWTATDPSGNSASCQQRVTVLSEVTVTFLSPLDPGVNEVTHGQTVAFKVQLRDCTGAPVLDGLTATLKVQGIESTGPTNSVFDEVIEVANGNGISGSVGVDGTLVLRGNHDHFNLDTNNLIDANTTANSQRFYRATITVLDDTTGCAVGSRAVIIETRQ